MGSGHKAAALRAAGKTMAGRGGGQHTELREPPCPSSLCAPEARGQPVRSPEEKDWKTRRHRAESDTDADAAHEDAKHDQTVNTRSRSASALRDPGEVLKEGDAFPERGGPKERVLGTGAT